MMRGQLLLGSLGLLFVLLWPELGKTECVSVSPDEQGKIEQHIVFIDQVPVRLSASICSNTTITVAGTTVLVTNASTVLLSNFIVESTITLTPTLTRLVLRLTTGGGEDCPEPLSLRSSSDPGLTVISVPSTASLSVTNNNTPSIEPFRITSNLDPSLTSAANNSPASSGNQGQTTLNFYFNASNYSGESSEHFHRNYRQKCYFRHSPHSTDVFSTDISSSNSVSTTDSSSQQSSSSISTSSLVPVSSSSTPTTSQCGVTLPGSCANLPITNGLVPLTLLTASCLLDLGPFGVRPVALCLGVNLNLFSQGQPIADCLLRTLGASCPGSLPQACIDLQAVNGIALEVSLPACVASLGPYNSGAAALCLAINSITSATTGFSIFGYLQRSSGLAPTLVTVTDPALCPTQPPSPSMCAVASLPDECLSLSIVNGLDLNANIRACLQALALYAVGDVASCLVTSVVTTLTSGQSIVTCLRNSLGSECIASLPQVCLDLSVANNAVNAALCLAALCPLGLGIAGACLSSTSGLTSGDAFIQCLISALFP
ncbi:hypothetical protein LZ30DRAFT_692037 [Colletotrichum cereale]|nr:hypothetical protein LZ30DRAFT_692037 [Colletotrichum cereale]